MLISELFEHLAQQTRVDLGQSIQRMFVNAFKREYPSAKIISISGTSSTSEDVVIKLDGETVQFEIKTRQNPSSPNIVYTRALRRGDKDEIFDSFARHYSNGKSDSFSDLIDQHRKEHTDVGFPGDDGVAKSGSIPRTFRTTDEEFLKKLRTYVAGNFASRGDNYFVIFDAIAETFFIYFTGHGSNSLGAGRFPGFSIAFPSTYGSGYKGSFQAAMKAVINTKSSRAIKLSTFKVRTHSDQKLQRTA